MADPAESAPHDVSAVARRPEVVDLSRRLRGHGGDFHLVSLDEGDLGIEFLGACRGCPAATFTFTAVVEPTLRAIPGVDKVSVSGAHVSKYVARRVLSLQSADSHCHHHGAEGAQHG
ncbi:MULTISPECIES: NifU family protein [unclassified Nocardioides]|uniref:NifU family protein n=1 Tax=unclassified Nocardioides TaxID=2615069 RepID=UPI0009F09ED2|nr:Rieske domain protein [Nocardioides sp. PD653-B2]GAW53808.1 Rieske domain protein [Nocardioides sp. PD653]